MLLWMLRRMVPDAHINLSGLAHVQDVRHAEWSLLCLSFESFQVTGISSNHLYVDLLQDYM
jgi:hypothetical protein